MKRFKDILCVVAPGTGCKPVVERAVTLAENNQASNGYRCDRARNRRNKNAERRSDLRRPRQQQ